MVTEPTTPAGRRIQPWLAAQFFSRGGRLPAEAHAEATAEVLAIEEQARAVGRQEAVERAVRETLAVVDGTTPLSIGEPLLQRCLAHVRHALILDGVARPGRSSDPEPAPDLRAALERLRETHRPCDCDMATGAGLRRGRVPMPHCLCMTGKQNGEPLRYPTCDVLTLVAALVGADPALQATREPPHE